MKKSLIFVSALVSMFAFSACDSKSSENGTASQEQPSHHSSETSNSNSNGTAMSREEHIKLVKAEEVQAFDQVNEATKVGITKLTEQYLLMKESLVASNAQQASDAAKSMQASLEELKGIALEASQKTFLQERSQSIATHLQQIVGTEDILQQRTHFAQMSKPFTELVSAFGTGKGSLYYQFCPMAFDNKGGYWLSESKEIRNPFYPEEMLTCGRVAREL